MIRMIIVMMDATTALGYVRGYHFRRLADRRARAGEMNLDE